MPTKKPLIRKETRDKIVAQALSEITFARSYKQGKIKNWQKNENLYYALKTPTEDSRANIELGRAQEFVHTLLSKIDNPLVFKFTKRKDSQLKRVKRLNALRTIDASDGFWDIKDIAGKKQAIIYGRAIYSYHAESPDGEYCSHLNNIDVYDFLVDPSAGGIDIERAKYLGNYGVVKMRNELEKGMKDGIYLKTETEQLLAGSGNADGSTQEETNKSNRTYDQNVTTAQKENGNKDKYKFWQWYTTYNGKRYYLLLNESGSSAIRIEELADLFPAVKKLGDAMWPIWTWAAFIDLTEFWTPSYLDYVREIFMGQSVSINQAIDNSEQINKPQKLVNVGAVENLADLKYRRGGNYIKIKKEVQNVKNAVDVITVAAIDTPLKVYDKLEAIQEKASGVTAGAKGVSKENTLGVYEGNQENSADRFGLLNKSYAFGYKRFAKLWELGVRDNLTKETAVDILGPNGVEVEKVSRRDIFRKDEEFGLIIEASDAETALAETEKRTKLAFLSSNAKNSIQNQQKAYEMAASIAGFKEEDIRQLLDTSEVGDAELMSEAERDIEDLLDGKKIKPNEAATTAYKQRFVDYMRDHQEDISMEQFTDLAEYVILLDPIIMRNMVRQAQIMATKMASEMTGDPALLAKGQGKGVDTTPAEKALQELPAGGGAPAGNITGQQ
ncbi:MAG: hypothetical protein WC767_02290 [Candidatus Paceibacterota bacterium]